MAGYFADEKRKTESSKKEKRRCEVMTVKTLEAMARDRGFYETPELNESLYPCVSAICVGVAYFIFEVSFEIIFKKEKETIPNLGSRSLVEGTVFC